ncbi:MAG: sensor histidine kinase [Planctomycetes bacterium]|nr:sensor histidine kinase [Planctomycetota bacterium]
MSESSKWRAWADRGPLPLVLTVAGLIASAAAMVAVSLCVATYAFALAATQGGRADPDAIAQFGRTTGERGGPALQGLLLLLMLRWLASRRAIGQYSGLLLATGVGAATLFVTWQFGHLPDAGDGVFVGALAFAASIGVALGHSERRRAAWRRELAHRLHRTTSLEGLLVELADSLRATRPIDAFATDGEATRWLASSDGTTADFTDSAPHVACPDSRTCIGSRGDTAMATAIAEIAAVVDLQQTRLQLRAEGERAERERLAGDIHDTIAQDLAGVTMHLEAAASGQQPPPAAAEHLTAATAAARSALAELRGLVWALRPEGSRLPFRDALLRQIERTVAETGLDITASLDPDLTTLPPEIELCVLRVVQEGLRNAIRHAGPRRIDIDLRLDGEQLTLAIADDGRGTPAAAVVSTTPTHGAGLATVQQRVRRLAGTTTFASTPGHGFRLLVHLPRRRR